MNINGITAGSIHAIDKLGSQLQGSRTANSNGMGEAMVSHISDGASMLAKLSDLKTSDPEKFQSTMKDMADHMRQAAKEQGGDAAKFLNALADKVTEAAKTGDLSSLKPPSGPPPAGGPRGAHGPPGAGGPGPAGPPGRTEGAGSSHGGSATKKSTEAADANGDGKVSTMERIAYDAKHPKLDTSKANAA